MEINTTEHNQEYQFQLRLKLLILLHQVTSKKVSSLHPARHFSTDGMTSQVTYDGGDLLRLFLSI